MKACPKCGGEVKVRDTRHNDEHDETYRRYVCSSCGIMFFSVEYQVEENEAFFRNWRKADRKMKGKEERGNDYSGTQNIRSFDADTD